MPAIHEMVELIKAIAWPGVVLYLVMKFKAEIGALLREMPHVVRRMRSAHGLGVEIELDKIGDDLPLAQLQAHSLELALPKVPTPDETQEENQDAKH